MYTYVNDLKISKKISTINYTTRQYIPEDSKLHTRRRENLESHNNYAP
jgi:hypothetical protein